MLVNVRVTGIPASREDPLAVAKTKAPPTAAPPSSPYNTFFEPPLFPRPSASSLARLSAAGVMRIVISTATDNMGMLRMLLDDRFDYTLVSVKEAEELSRQAGELGGHIVAILMPDMPSPQGRYLACTRKVDDALIDRINKAIEESGFSRG